MATQKRYSFNVIPTLTGVIPSVKFFSPKIITVSY